ncbi:MAG TPA: hypothetical protein VNZ48_21815 [Xanthobacteraceae bacterium]|jgi:hypothetical protein|nr:hypothetical protein [Xanthobacteraceae bacterium]
MSGIVPGALEAGPMGKQLYLRIVSALGFVALAALFVAIDPFLSVGAGLSTQTPAVSVNRNLKGDRLPLRPTVVDVPDGRAGMRQDVAPRAQIPFACDAAVSLIRSPKSAPPSADVYRRCMA